MIDAKHWYRTYDKPALNTKHVDFMKTINSMASIGFSMYVVFIGIVAIMITELLINTFEGFIFVWWEKYAIIYTTIFYSWVLIHLVRKKEKSAAMYSNGRQFLYRISVDWVIFLAFVKVIRVLFWVASTPTGRALAMSVYYLIISMILLEYGYNVLGNARRYYADRNNFVPRYISTKRLTLLVAMVAMLLCKFSGLMTWRGFVEKSVGDMSLIHPVALTLLAISLWSTVIGSIFIVVYLFSSIPKYVRLSLSLYMSSWAMMIFVFFGLITIDIFVIISGSIISQALYIFREIYTILFVLFVGLIYKYQVKIYKKYGISGEI